MPRHHYGRQRTQRVPAPAYKAPKLKKPNTGDLKKILENYVSASEADRLNALANAAIWYEDGNANGAIAYVLTNHLFPTNQVDFKKSLDRADECRKRALWSLDGRAQTSTAERETALCMAVKLYEKCCAKIPNLPAIQTYRDQYEAKKAELANNANAFQSRFGEGVASMEKALGLPLKITFCEQCNQYMAMGFVNGCQSSHPDKLQTISPTIEKLVVTDSKTARSINLAEKTLMYNKETASELQTTIRREGVLVAVLRELPALVRYSAVQKAADGQTWTTNRDAHIAFQAQALNNLEAWLKGNESPNRLVRKSSGSVVMSPAAGPKAPRPAGFGGRQKLTPGQLFPTGSNNDRIYQLLKDGQAHEYSEIAGVMSNPASTKTYLRDMIAKAPTQWGFKVEQSGTKYTLVNPPAQGGAN